MTKLFYQRLLLVLFPYILVVGLYVSLDPFMVLYSYNDYISVKGVYKNGDYISTETFLQISKTTKYNSFIFGSSRCQAFKASKWEKFTDGNAFQFYSSGETIWGINKKIKYLNKTKTNIKNVLIVIDQDCLIGVGNSKGILFIKHPLTSEGSWEEFHITFIKAFLQDFFFYKFIKLKLFGIKDEASNMFDFREIGYDKTHNDVYYKWFDDDIKKDSLAFYKKLIKNISYQVKKDTVYLPSILKDKNRALLSEIALILKEQKTSVKIIINPMNDQLYFNKSDLSEIQTLFGKENVYDFSGINHFTTNISNYYDNVHFRPCVADSIMKYIYK